MTTTESIRDYWTAEAPSLKARLLSRAMRTRAVFQGILWTQMPLLAMVGPRVKELDEKSCRVELPFGFRNRNIFGTMYFAASMMAAEAATGVLVLYHGAKRSDKQRFIVRNVAADFIKPARSTVVFECLEGQVIADAFEEAARTGERVERTLEVVGRREDGQVVARVTVQWTWRA